MAKSPSKPKLPPHVDMRGGVYRYYRKIPKELVEGHPDWKGKVFIRRSLRTTDLAVARSEAAVIDGEIEKLFRQAKADLRIASMPRMIESMSIEEMDAFIDRSTGRLSVARSWNGYGGVIQELPDQSASSFIQWAFKQERVTVTETVRAQLEARLYQQLSPRPDQSSHGRFLESIRGDLAPKHEPPPPPKSVTFDELWAEFQTDPSRVDLDKPSSDAQAAQAPAKRGLDYSSYTTVIELVREICGGKRSVRSITRDDMKRVRTALMYMPTYAKITSRRPEYDGWKYEDIATDAKSRIEDGDYIETIKPKVINKYLDNINRLFKFAVHEGYIQSSPADNLSVRASSMERERDPFTNEQLSKIFPKGWMPNTDIDWMMLLALLHGCRGNELAQLECSDIFVKDGTHSISISEYTIDENGNIVHSMTGKNGKSLKTKAAQRTIPVHQLALDMGFIEHVKERKTAGHQRVFVTNSWGKRGSFYDSIRDDIDTHLDRLGVKSDKTTFYSFRHNFRDACGNALIKTEHMREIGGWSRGGAESVYGKGTSPAVLKPVIDKIRYDIPIFKWR